MPDVLPLTKDVCRPDIVPATERVLGMTAAWHPAIDAVLEACAGAALIWLFVECVI